MAATELSRMLFAANSILEMASTAVHLSKRAAIALAILYLEDEPESTRSVTNQEMQEQFLKYSASTELSVKKDVSAAKSELLRQQYIDIRGKVSQFGINSAGRLAVEKMNQAMESGIEELGLTSKERGMIRELIGLSTTEPKKSNGSIVAHKNSGRKSS
jgi:hypothetical protein